MLPSDRANASSSLRNSPLTSVRVAVESLLEATKTRAFSIPAIVGLLFGCSLSSSAQIALDGTNHCTSAGHAVTSVSCTLSNVSVGDLITVEFADKSGYATSVSDSKNGTHTTIYYVGDSADPNYSGMAYVANSLSGSVTVKVTLSASDSWAFVSAQAWKGAARTSVLDTGSITQHQTSTSGTVANASCGTAQAPSGSGELVVAYLVPHRDTSVTAGSSYTLIDSPNSTYNPAFPEYSIQTTAQSTNGAYTSAADDFTDGCAAFRPYAPPAAGIITTFAGNGFYNNNGNGGPALDASFEGPAGVATDSAGNIYVADTQASVIRKISAATGAISTVAGNGTTGYSGDGGQATSAMLNGPQALTLDSSGNIYIADTWNSRIRKVTVSTGKITTIVGSSTNGYSGDGGPATSAKICDPLGVAVDGSGNIYISDSSNNVIRKVTASTGIITTIVSLSAGLNIPAGLALDPFGHLYIADAYNHIVRQLTISTGAITTFAGSGTAGYSGDGGLATSATLKRPISVALDSAGDLFICEQDNNVIRAVSSTSGAISTVAGTGTAGYSGDGGLATSAQLSSPQGVALDASGNLYIGDWQNHRIRQVGAPQSLLVSKMTPTISWATPAPITYGTSLTATQFSATSNVPGTFAYAQAAGAVLPAGPQTLSVTFTPTDTVHYTIATASVQLMVNKATPPIVWPTPSPITYGTPLSATQLDATSSVGGTFVYSPVAGTVLQAGTQTLSVTFTPNDTADYVTVTGNVPLVVNSVAKCNTTGYGYVRTITIDHGKVAGSDQVNFPLLFSTTDPSFKSVANGGRVANNTGFDIIFSLDPSGATKLDHEMELYNPATGQILAWVRVPLLSHTVDTVLYVFYGNPNITSSQQNASSVWDSSYLSVLHLDEATGTTVLDSTSKTNNGTKVSQASPSSVSTGQFNGAQSFNGTSDFISLPPSMTSGLSQFSVSFWTDTIDSGSNGTYWNRPQFVGDSTGGSPSGDFGIVTNGGTLGMWSGLALNQDNSLLSNKLINDGTWHRVDAVNDGSEIKLFLDGTETGQSLASGLSLDSYGWYLGAQHYVNGGAAFFHQGSMDEFRFSNSARSDDWIATEYNNESAPSSFYNVNSESTLTVSPGSVSLYAGGTQEFAATAIGNCSTAVTWSMSPTGPGFGVLTQDGTYTAPASVMAEQTVTITATSTSSPTTAGSGSVTLLPVTPPILSLSEAVQPPYVVGAPQEFSATLTNEDGTPLGNVPVSFTVTGVNAGSGSGTTDSDGVATFSYVGINTGNDTIQASVGQTSSNRVFATWIVPSTSTPILTTSVLGRFFALNSGCCWFSASPDSTPLFEQFFPSINFDPPSGSIPGTTGVDVSTHPFTDVTVGKDGKFSGTIVAQGNGYTAGIGSLTAFQAAFTGSFIVRDAGDVVIPIYVDNGFILGIGGGATWVSGPIGGGAPSTTPFGHYPVVGAFSTSIGGATVTVHFPAAGTYPYELDYVEDGQGLQSLMMSGSAAANGLPPGVPSGGTLTLSPNSFSAQPVGSTQTFTITATDAAGNPVSNLSIGLVVSLDNTQQLSKLTDNNGIATFTYAGSAPGTDQVQAVALISGMVTYSNIVNVPWSQSSGGSSGTGTGSGTGATLSVSASAASTSVLPNTPLQLTGTASDGSLQQGDTISLAWSQVSGPGSVEFANPQQASTTATFSEAGSYQVQLTATDRNGTASAVITIAVPGSVQGWIGSPLYGASVSGIVPITVSSGQTLTSGVLTVYPADNPSAVTVLNNNTTGSGQIGTWDTTGIANGSYWITLQATNSSGTSMYNLALVTVVGNFKPGRVTSTVTDLVVPAKGLAVKIQRTYDSLNAGKSGDFGYGWSLGTTTDLVVDPKGNVTFTLGGQRRTFYLTPQILGWFLPYYVPVFTPEAGMHGTLVSAGTGCTSLFDYLVPDGSLWACVGGGFWTPLGYVYTDPSGTAYTMAANGQLLSIVDKNGNKLTVSSTGITTSTGVQIAFARDNSGRITTITEFDSQQQPLYQYLYGYDGSGNLVSVTYPNTPNSQTCSGAGAPNTSQYSYYPDTEHPDYPAHFYASGTDARCNQLPSTSYFGSNTTDAHGNSVAGKLQSVTDALGEKTSYAYDLTTNTTTITYPPDGGNNQGTATMVYNNAGNLLSSTDPLGHVTTNTYDTNQNLLSTTDPLGHKTCYTYDGNGNRTSVSYPVQQNAACSTIGSITAYNQYSEPTETIDEIGNTRYFNYDINFNPQSVTDGLGTLASFIFNNDGTMQAGAIGYDISTDPSKASHFAYDSNGNLASRTDALGRTTSYTYNSLGQKATMVEPLLQGASASAATTTYNYDPFGNLTETDAPLGRTTKSTYDPNGNKHDDTDARQHVTTYTYDGLNRLFQTNYPDGTYTHKTYDFRGNVIDEWDRALTNQTGIQTHYVYDLAGRETSVTRAYGTSSAATTSYTYYDDGRKKTETDALGHTTTYTYDIAGDLTGVSGPNGNFIYGYDLARNRTSMTDGNSYTTGYVYDTRKRLIETDYPDANHTKKTNSYDGPGNLTSVIDQAGNEVDYTYDAANQLQSVVQTSSPNPKNITSYSYDPLGNLIGLNDANSHLTESAFDLLSQQSSKTLPDGSLIEKRYYDAAGNLTSLTHFNGKTTTYEYDELNRLTKRLPDATTGEIPVIFSYTATGKRQKMSDASGDTYYYYDSMDRLYQKQTPEGTLNYTYDAAGHLATMTSSHANGVSVSYTYDSLNRLSTVVDSQLAMSTQTTTYGYDPASNVASVQYPNGVQYGFNYDELNRLKQIATGQTGYLYDLYPAGNRKDVTEYGTNRTTAWTYDGIYRLTNETISLDPNNKNGSVSYNTLDAVGNRQSVTSSIPGLNPVAGTFNQDDELASESYDSNGNVTASGGKTFSYNTENQLVSMNSGAVQIVYDGDGNRVKKIVGGVTTQYLVDDLNPTGYSQVVEELTNGSVSRTYSYGLQRISQNQVVSNTWTPSFYGYDGFGTVRQLTNSAGAITDTYDYDAFGNKINSTGTTPNNYLYRGEQWDSDLGLYYLRARYYNPMTGRFMSRDPEAGVRRNPKTLHKYLYVGGDPVNWSDPRGRAEAANYAITLEKSFKAAVVFNAVGCGIGIGSSLATGTLMEVFGDDPKGAALTAWGCLTMTVSATGVVQVGLDTVALAGCGYALYQAYEAENVYFEDLNAKNYERADEDLKKVYAGLYGGIGGCTAAIYAIAAE